jgi:hypothetical protein
LNSTSNTIFNNLNSLSTNSCLSCIGLKPNNGLSIDATTKFLQYNLNVPSFRRWRFEMKISPFF